MSKTYAVPDLHGRADLLELALEEIESSPSGGTVVFLGDYVDRGPQSRQIIERLMAGPKEACWKWICLKGNHEQMMADAIFGRPSRASWIQNGGGYTLVSYGHPVKGYVDLTVVPREHAEWIDALPLVHADGKRVFVHAGVDPMLPAGGQRPHTALWQRLHRTVDRGHPEGYVVHGHTPYEDGPVVLDGRVNLDTLAWYTGNLHVAVFDDDREGGPSKIVKVEGTAYEELDLAAS